MSLPVLSQTPATPASQPLDSYLNSAQLLLSSFPNQWKAGKSYGQVDTFKFKSAPVPTDPQPVTITADGEVWCARRSYHTVPEGYQGFKSGLLVDHSIHEKEYIEALKEIRLIETLPSSDPSLTAQVWNLTYHLPAPLNRREFLIVFLSIETRPDEEFLNLSIPYETGQASERLQKGNVRGRYVSIERVRKTGKGEELEWLMMTSSTPGGNVPAFLTNSSLPGEISKDVPCFLKWLEDRRS